MSGVRRGTWFGLRPVAQDEPRVPNDVVTSNRVVAETLDDRGRCRRTAGPSRNKLGYPGTPARLLPGTEAAGRRRWWRCRRRSGRAGPGPRPPAHRGQDILRAQGTARAHGPFTSASHLDEGASPGDQASALRTSSGTVSQSQIRARRKDVPMSSDRKQSFPESMETHSLNSSSWMSLITPRTWPSMIGTTTPSTAYNSHVCQQGSSLIVGGLSWIGPFAPGPMGRQDSPSQYTRVDRRFPSFSTTPDPSSANKHSELNDVGLFV